MSNYLSIRTICRIHKKPAEVIGTTGFKKIVKTGCSCEDVINLGAIEEKDCKIINGFLHI